MATREIVVKVTADVRDFERSLRKIRRGLRGEYDLGMGLVVGAALSGSVWLVDETVFNRPPTPGILFGPIILGARLMWRNR